MKIKLGTILQLIIILMFLTLGFSAYHFYKEFKVYKDNQDNYLNSQARELQLTKKEIKQALDLKVTELISKFGIKSKQIDHYIQTEYNIKDSLKITPVTVYDSVKNNYSFMAKKGCWAISGTVSQNEVTLSSEVFNDTLDIFQYHDWDNKLLWGLIKWNKYSVAGVYSRCKGDTIKTIKNYLRR